MPLDPSKIKKILVVSLTNIGDVILTLPVVDILLRDFPNAQQSLVIGPKVVSLFRSNPHFKKVYVYDKHQPPFKSLCWMLELMGERFDLVVDLRNSAIPYLIFPRYRTPADKTKKRDRHMRDKHLDRLKAVHSFSSTSNDRRALFISEEDKNIMREAGVSQPYVVIAPGAAHPRKRWGAQNFAQLADRLKSNFNVKVVLVGDEKDRVIGEQISMKVATSAVNFTGRTTLIQLAHVIKGASLVISNDSAPMHLASYLNRPVLAFFGEVSDPVKYGPWSETSYFFRSMESIGADDVFRTLNFDGKDFSFKR